MPMAPPGPAELHLPFASGWRADLPFACTSCRGSRAQRIGRQARAAFLRRTARSRAGFRLHVVGECGSVGAPARGDGAGQGRARGRVRARVVTASP